MSDTLSEVQAILASRNRNEFLERIEPHLRRMVDAVDEDAIEIFDTSFESEASAVAERLASTLPAGHAESPDEFQAAGFRTEIAAHIVAFLVNIAATVSVDYAKVVAPDTMPGASTQSTMPANELLLRELERSKLQPQQKEKIRQFISDDEVLQQALSQLRVAVAK